MQNRQGSIKRRAPPPPIAKKPALIDRKVVNQTNNLYDDESTLCKTYSGRLSKKLTNPLVFTEELKKVVVNGLESKHLSTTSLKLIADSTHDDSKGTSYNLAKCTEEVEHIYQRPNYVDTKNDNPKSEKTNSLTEVSNITGTLKTSERIHNEGDDTLDFTLSDGFDTSTCIEIDIENHCPEELSQIDIPVVPPPPDVDFSDDDDSVIDESLQLNLKLFTGPDPPSPTESLNSEFFIPPPLRPDMDELSENNLTNPDTQSLFENANADEFDFSLGLSSQYDSGSDLDLPDFDDVKATNAEDNSTRTNSISSMNDSVLCQPIKSVVLPAQTISTEINKKDSLSEIITKNSIPVVYIDELKNKIENHAGDFDSTRNIEVTADKMVPYWQCTPCNETETKGKTVLKSDKHAAKNSVISLTIDVDSGHSTAQSQEVSDSEKKIFTESAKRQASELITTKNKTESRESSTTMRRKVFRKISNASRLSKSWSSCSSSDEEKSVTSKPKVNLRKMFLKHLHSFESDGEDNFIESPKSELKRIDVVKRKSATSSDSEIETHLNDIDVNKWSISDVGEWLELIGLPNLKHVFVDKAIDGKALTNIDTNLLEQMDIDSNEDQELILSEIYALQNQGDVDLELSMLDALDKSSGEEREKLLALIEALQAPSNESYINNYLISNPSQETNFQVSNQSSSGSNRLPDNSQRSIHSDVERGTPPFEIKPNFNNPGGCELEEDKQALIRRLVGNVYDPTTKDKTANDSLLTADLENNKKKSKRKGFFASLRRKGHKKAKSSVSQSTISTLSQSNPQGMVKILYLPQNGNDEVEIQLLVSLQTTSKEVCKMCLDYLSLHEDVRCFFIVISRKDRKVQNVDLTGSECPLMFQCKWTDLDTYQFELKQKSDGYIIVNNEDVVQQEMVSVKLGISSRTTTKDIMPVLLKKFKEKDELIHYSLQQAAKDDQIPLDAPLLDLPLSGYKFHVFKLLNSSSLPSKQRAVSFTEVKKMETKISLLEKQMDKLTNQIEDHRRVEIKLKQEHKDQQTYIKKIENEVEVKRKDVNRLQEELKNNKKESEATQQIALPIKDKELNSLRVENETLQKELKQQKYQIEHYENSVTTYKESKLLAQKECEIVQEKLRKMENQNEDLKEKLEALQNMQRNKTSDNSEQVKKLYAENKENLRCIRILEDKLAETEHQLSQKQLDQETDSAEVLELRNRCDVLEHQILEKDSKRLELEYKIQKKERDMRELEDQLEEEQRKKKKEIEAKDISERKNEDLLTKIDNMKQHMLDKDKQIQSLKNQTNKQEKKLNKQKTIVEAERNESHFEIQNLKRMHQEETSAVESKLKSLQKLLVEKDLNRKQNEFDFAKQKEELNVTVKDLERKLCARDVIIERLENKIAKSDLNISSQYQDQQISIQEKEEIIQQLEIEIAKLDNEQASRLREEANTVRLKDNTITKLENRIKKMETNNRENVKKFETFISDKDRLIQQVNDDRDKETKDLKSRARKCEDLLSDKEKLLNDMTRKSNDMKASYDIRMKKREKEYKQQKFLLEKVLEIVNVKAPSLLHHLQESLDEGNMGSPQNKKKSNNAVNESEQCVDEWC